MKIIDSSSFNSVSMDFGIDVAAVTTHKDYVSPLAFSMVCPFSPVYCICPLSCSIASRTSLCIYWCYLCSSKVFSLTPFTLHSTPQYTPKCVLLVNFNWVRSADVTKTVCWDETWLV